MCSQRRQTLLYVLALSVSMIRCAGQIPPSGGPVDTTPPVVLWTRPDSNAIRVQAQSVDVEFNEYVDRQSVEESIFISPYLGPLEFDWHGESVTVMFADSLRKNTTYVVTVGTDVKDLRAGNRMQSSYALAFSTGDSIDRGSIAGRVYDDKPEGVMVFAYRLGGILPDTLDPGRVKPDYVTQTGKDGSFLLSHMSFGPYRVVAVRDQFRDLLYGKEVDQYGVTTGDVRLTNRAPSIQDIYFRMTGEDTTRPFLTRAEPLNSRLVQLRFSEPLDSITFRRGTISVKDTATGSSPALLMSALSTTTPSTAWLVLGTELEEGHVYSLSVRGLFDKAGNGIDTANSSSIFEGSDKPDTLKPGVSVRGIRDSTRGYPPGKPVVVDFSEPVLPLALTGILALRLTDTGTVAADLRWIDPTVAAIIPRDPLLPAAWYQLNVRLDSVMDQSGNRNADSTLILHFQTRDSRTTGSVQGTVVDRRPDSVFHPSYVIAHDIDRREEEPFRIRLERPGKFTFAALPESRYGVSAFVDADSSGGYSYGRIYPFVPSEPFTVLNDTLKVRARWDLEGVLVQFR